MTRQTLAQVEAARAALGRHPARNLRNAVNDVVRAAKKGSVQPDDEAISERTRRAIRDALRSCERAERLARAELDALYERNGWRP